jgi:mRNA interferase MazF
MVTGSYGYVPDTGDLVWLDFDPHAGREQAGRRPAVVLSPSAYNQKASLVVACPITSHIKGYPFEVALPKGLPVAGVILADHVKSLDWRARHAEKASKVSKKVLEEIRDRLGALLGFV